MVHFVSEDGISFSDIAGLLSEAGIDFKAVLAALQTKKNEALSAQKAAEAQVTQLMQVVDIYNDAAENAGEVAEEAEARIQVITGLNPVKVADAPDLSKLPQIVIPTNAFDGDAS